MWQRGNTANCSLDIPAICFEVALISCRWSKAWSKASENNGLIRPNEIVPDLNNREIAPISDGVETQTPGCPAWKRVAWGNWADAMFCQCVLHLCSSQSCSLRKWKYCSYWAIIRTKQPLFCYKYVIIGKIVLLVIFFNIHDRSYGRDCIWK